MSLKENFHYKFYYFEKKTFSIEDLFFILQFLFFVADYYFLLIMIFKLFYKLSSKSHHIYSKSTPIHYFIYSCSSSFQKQKLWSHLTLRYCLLTLPTGFPGQDSLCLLPTQSIIKWALKKLFNFFIFLINFRHNRGLNLIDFNYWNIVSLVFIVVFNNELLGSLVLNRFLNLEF